MSDSDHLLFLEVSVLIIHTVISGRYCWVCSPFIPQSFSGASLTVSCTVSNSKLIAYLSSRLWRKGQTIIITVLPLLSTILQIGLAATFDTFGQSAGGTLCDVRDL